MSESSPSSSKLRCRSKFGSNALPKFHKRFSLGRLKSIDFRNQCRWHFRELHWRVKYCMSGKQTRHERKWAPELPVRQSSAQMPNRQCCHCGTLVFREAWTRGMMTKNKGLREDKFFIECAVNWSLPPNGGNNPLFDWSSMGVSGAGNCRTF